MTERCARQRALWLDTARLFDCKFAALGVSPTSNNTVGCRLVDAGSRNGVRLPPFYKAALVGGALQPDEVEGQQKDDDDDNDGGGCRKTTGSEVSEVHAARARRRHRLQQQQNNSAGKFHYHPAEVGDQAQVHHSVLRTIEIYSSREERQTV